MIRQPRPKVYLPAHVWRLERHLLCEVDDPAIESNSRFQLMRVAFLGLGKMGAGMAGRLLAAGHSLAVYNRTPERAAPFAKLGARVADTPRSAAHKADVIIGMTADDESSRAMWLGEQGALAADNVPHALAIECSTLSHDWVLELAAKVREREFRFVDSPVTGLPDAAAKGTLTLLVGADAADLDAARPIFASLATRVLHFGGVGQGTAYKLMINLLGAVQIASAAEAVVLAERAGLDLKLVADAVASGQAASPQVVRNVRRFVAGDHGTNVNFTPALAPERHRVRAATREEAGRGLPVWKCCRRALSQALRARRGQRQREPHHRRAAQDLAPRDGRLLRGCRRVRCRYRAPSIRPKRSPAPGMARSSKPQGVLR